MARPTQTRRICALPRRQSYDDDGTGIVRIMTVEEYEALRLMDYVGLTQAECARQMGVGRTTVQWIYDSARKKLAAFLVEGCGLRIEGGHYALCAQQDGCPQGRGCLRVSGHGNPNDDEKGRIQMIIAVTYDNGQIFQHFGHTEAFKLYEVEAQTVVSSRILPTGESGHGALAGLLAREGVHTLICGGIGPGAQQALAEAGIELKGGVRGGADEAVEAYLAGTLQFAAGATCDHHGEGHHCHGGGHHGEGHGCHGGGHHGEGHGCHGGHHHGGCHHGECGR